MIMKDMMNIMDSISDSSQYATFALISGNIVINTLLYFISSSLFTYYRSGFVSLIWGTLNDISSLAILSMISINIPGIARFINSIIINFLYMDIFQTSLWIGQIIEMDDINDHPINEYF